MAVLGYMYENGIAGLPQDPTLAAENYGPAALGWHNRRAYDGIVRLANGGNATAQSVLEQLRSKGIESYYLKH